MEAVKQEFEEWCAQQGKTYQSAGYVDCVQFLWSVYNDQDRFLSAKTIRNMASALSMARVHDNLAPISDEPLVCRFLTAIQKHRPSGPSRDEQSVPFAPADVLRVVPRGDSLEDVMKRTLYVVRAVTMMRPGGPISILPSSIVTTTHLHNSRRRVVGFKFDSKGSTAAGFASDSQYVEFLPDDSPQVVFCPARNLLRLKEMVEQRERAAGRPPPKSLFLKTNGEPYCEQTVAKFVTNMIRAAGFAQFSAHDLRAMSNQVLQANGVPAEDIALRGGWASQVSRVRQQHYTRYRFVTQNFAVLLLAPPAVAQE